MNEDTQFTPQTPPTGIPPIETPSDKKHHNGFSPIIGIAIIVVLIIFGGFYFWGAQIGTDSLLTDDGAAQEELTPSAAGFAKDTTDVVTEKLQKQGTSTDPLSIEDDLNATDLGNFEAELDNLDTIFAQ